MTRADQRRTHIQSELRRLPPSGDGWVERRRRRLLADFAFATDQELARYVIFGGMWFSGTLDDPGEAVGWPSDG
jgi:hypothetical protein